jgi:hypothetical protein
MSNVFKVIGPRFGRSASKTRAFLLGQVPFESGPSKLRESERAGRGGMGRMVQKVKTVEGSTCMCCFEEGSGTTVTGRTGRGGTDAKSRHRAP